MKQFALRMLLFVALSLGMPLCVRAQSNWQPPTTVRHNAAGDYIVSTPGQPTTTVVPDARGGYVVVTPGRGSSTIVPNANGSYTIVPPPEIPQSSGSDDSRW